MRRGLGFTIAWVGATIVAVVVAAAAVGSVRSQVTDTPTALGAPTAVALAAAPPADTPPVGTPPVDAGSATTTLPSSTIAPVPDSADESTTSTTAVSSVDATTTTTSPASTSTSSTTTTTTPTVWQQLPPYSTPGGTVTILVNGESVKFGGAVPTTGWTVEFEKLGPPEVEIHFERNDDQGDEVEFHAKYEDGELVVKIS